jgi:Porin PorA
MRKIAIACGVLGVIFVAASFLLAFWITPTYVARLQGNTNVVRNYNGTVRTLVNPAALRSGNLSGAIITGVPETLRRQVTVQQTAGNTALVRDATTVTVAGRQIGVISSDYAISRTTFQATAPHPSDWKITKATGQTFNWPIGTKAQNYTGWVPQTETTVPLRYVGQQPQGGINTNVYLASVPPSPIKNPQVLASLPASLPVSLLPGAVKAGLVPASLVASLAKAFPGATTVPLGYEYTNTARFWVAPPTGVVVNEKLTEVETGGIALPGGKLVPVFPVLSDSYAFTSSSVSAAVSDANNGSGAINLWGIVVPIVVGIVGALLLVAAAMLWLRSRRHGVAGPAHAARGPSMDPAHADTR